MYCGHVGIGLGAKGLRPRVSLALLLIAAFGPDWCETALMALGVRNTPGWSHSIPAVVVLAALFALFVLTQRGANAWQDALFVGAVCVSHILVDYLTKRKPLLLNGPDFGLGLYQYRIVDFVMESAVILIGWTLYRRSLPTERQRNNILLYGLLVALLAMQALFSWKFANGG